MTKTLYWTAADFTRPVSAALLHLIAAALRAASDVLTRLAVRVAEKNATPPVHTVEFHSVYGESGAPEGALYINGELVGWIDGVRRL